MMMMMMMMMISSWEELQVNDEKSLEGYNAVVVVSHMTNVLDEVVVVDGDEDKVFVDE